MAQTPIGSATPYLTVARFFAYHDWQQVADMMRTGEDPRPSKLCLQDSTTDEGGQLLMIGLAACGELESACFIGRRYDSSDLQALANQDGTASLSSLTAKGRMEKVIADLWFWGVCQRRQPATADPARVPGALQALQELDRLRDGERIFGFDEAAEAGLPNTVTPDIGKRPNEVTLLADRLFGDHRGGSRDQRRTGL